MAIPRRRRHRAADGQVELTLGLTSDEGLELGGWTVDQLCIVAIGAGQCGDSLVSPGEDCDDGNAVDGDGCSACISDDPPDDPDDPDDPADPDDPDEVGDATGGCCSTGTGAGGPLALGALTLLLGWRRRR